MKAVTEFASVTLNQGIKAKNTLTAEGKTPEEIQASLGTTFKMEGEKLTYFINALEVAGKNTENLRRVIVMSLSEGETAPAKATKVEEMHYLPEFFMMVAPKTEPTRGHGKGGGRGKGGGGPKGSPWGLSPEEKALKNQKGPKPS